KQLLDNAARLATKSGDPLVAAQLSYYRAVTAAYEGNSAEAMAEAQRAETAFMRLAPRAVMRSQRAPDPRSSGIDTLLSNEAPTSTIERTAITGLAETMRLRASLLQQTGNTAESAALARRAERLLAANGIGASSTGARSLRLLASNQAIAGDYPGAAGTSAAAEQMFTKVVPGERPDALNLLREGTYLLKQNRVDAALDRF